MQHSYWKLSLREGFNKADGDETDAGEANG